MKRTILLIGLLFLISNQARAATITVGPSDCSAATINTAIGTASDGDTVLLTCTGSITWSATVTIPNTKGITLMVSGGTNTPKTSANFPLLIISNQNPAILANIGQGKSVTRISGFRFAPNTGPSDPFIEFAGAGTGVAGLGGFRLDNNYFDTISAKENVVVWSNNTTGDSVPAHGNLFGCIDNNTFHNVYRSDDMAFGPYNIQIWNFWHPTGSNQCWGCDGWLNNDFAFGSANTNFIEDNLFEQTAGAPGHMRHYISAELGGRYVSRHNTFSNNFPDTNADLHDAHGLCIVASNGAGNRGGEIYNNTITGTGYDRAMQLRGGSWVIRDNVITAGGGNPIEFDEYRAETSGSCDATSALTPIMPPWPVPTGATWSSAAPWVHFVTTNAQYQLPQQIFNTFAWNNTTSGGTQIPPSVPGGTSESLYIQANRDYFVGTTSPPSGIASYIPYTYPDPIRGTTGAPAVTLSPTSLSFGNQSVGTTSAPGTIIVTNTGTTTLTFSSNATISGVGASDFAVSGASTCKSGANVAPAATCTIVLTFTPSTTGSRVGMVSISDNATGSPHSASLGGTGTTVSNGQITINCPIAAKCTVVGQITMSMGGAVVPASVAISPMTGSVLINSTFPIVATVTNDPLNLGVIWSVSGTNCSGAACGTIAPLTSASNQTVTYTAPPTSPPGSVFITATTIANQASAQTNITVVTPVPPPQGPTGVNVFTPSCARVNSTTTCSFTGYAGPSIFVGVSSVTTSSNITGVQACKSVASCSALTLVNSVDQAGTKKTYLYRGINAGAGFNQVVVSASDLNAVNVSIFDTANVGAFDTSATKAGTASTNPTGPSLTTATANELVICVLGTNGTASAIAPPFVFDSVGKDGAAGAINPTASAISASWTSTNATYASVCGAFSVGTIPASINVTNNPLSVNVQSSATQTFRATVGNDPANQGVDWTCSASSGSCGSFSPTHTASGAATTWTAPALVPPGAAVTLLQHPKLLDQTSPFSIPISASTAGSTLCVFDVWNTAAGTMTVTDDKGETWGAAIDTVGSVAGRSAAIDCLPNNIGGVGSITVAIAGAAPTSHELYAREYTGLLASSIVDQFTHATGSASPMDSGSMSATTNANDVLLGCGLNGAASNFTAGNDGQGDNYSNLDIQTFLGSACEDFFPTTATNTYKATLTPDAASSSAMFVVALKAGTGTGTGNSAITVTATSTADPTKSAMSTVTLTAAPPPISVVVNPVSGTLTAGTGTISLTNTVSNDGSSGGVTISLNGLGSISATTAASNTPITYTPPAAVNTATNAVITFTSVTDTTKSATASILVNPVTGGGGGTGGTTATCPGGVCPAFAGALGTAQGGGALSLGGSGRGGTGPPQVFLVTNLNDSGAGSLRACVQAIGPRFCIFRVSGHSAQQSRLQVSNPYLYVAGQTVPGGGFVQGGVGSTGQAFFISTHDVTIRYMTYDGAVSGISGGSCNNSTGSVGLELGSGNVFNVIVANNSHRWWGNKDLEFVSNGPGQNVHDVTMQNNMAYEPCNDHPVFTEPDVFGGGSQFASVNQDWHHNFLANGNHRVPLLAIRSIRWVNNIAYNTLQESDDFNWSGWGAIQGDIIGSKWVDGPNSSFHVFNIVDQADPTFSGDPADCNPGNTCDNGPAQGRYPGYYLLNNQGHAGTNTGSAPIAITHAVNDAGQISMTAAVTNAEGAKNPTAMPGSGSPNTCGGPSSTCWFRNAPLAAETFPITVDPVENLDAVLLPTVGNSQHLDCQGNAVSNRDSQDSRVILQYQNKGPGGAWENPSNYTGPHFPGAPAIPAFAPGMTAPCPMTFSTGLYDGWIQKYGLPTNDPLLWQKTDPKSGYLYIEDFLNGIIPNASSSTPPPPSGLPSTFFAMSSTLNGGSHNPSVTGWGVKRTWNNSPFCTFAITNPSSGVYDFSNCNAPLDLANSVGAKPDFVYGLTPCWAITGGNPTCTSTPCTGVYSSTHQCAQPPSDIGTTDAILKAHVTAMVNYVRGRYPGIHGWYIECVNEADLTSEWTGNMTQLVKYCTDIKTTAQAIDPTIIMLSPSATSYNTFGPHLFPAYMAVTGAAASFDALNMHPYFSCQSDMITPFGTTPCKIPDQAATANPVLDTFMASNGIASKPVFMSEAGWGNPPTNTVMTDTEREAWIGRLVMYMYNSGYAGVWSYTWDCPAGTLSSCDSTISGSTVGTGVATAWQTFQTWLAGSTHVNNSCNQNVDGHGTWSCAITSAGNAPQTILFNPTGNQTVTVSSTFTTQDLADGTSSAITAHQITAGVIPTRVR